MANQFYNFNYDPAKKGFAALTWRKVYGDVAVVSGQLQFTKAFIIHYGDILRGDATFNINIAAPFADGDTTFGFTQYSKGVHAYFKISGTVLSAETSDGTTTKNVVIPWSAAWTDTNTEFRIKWEAGLVTFFIGGQFKTSIGYSKLLDIPVSIVPNDSMSIFISSDSTDLFLLNYITVKSIQSFLMSEGNDNSIFEPFVRESDRISITDVVTVAPATIMGVDKVDTINLTENITVSNPV
jgi:hypothetical protein